MNLAREVAYDAFVDVMFHRAKPEDVLEAAYEKHSDALKRVDRNFIKEVLYGSLRWYSKIFWILQNTSKRELSSTTPQMQAALVVGTYQIFYCDKIPDRAAVNESVEYLRVKGQGHATSFANGILRQIARRAAYFPKPDKEKFHLEYLTLQFSHPRWMVERWLEQFKFEKLENMLAENNQIPPNSVRINTMMTPTEKSGELQDALLREERTHSERRNLRTALRLRESPNFESDSLFARGYYTIQDEAAQLVGFLVDPKPGEEIIDACAGPGGKLSHVYELANGQIKLTALDRSKTQFRRAQETMVRMGHTENLTWVQDDFLKWQSPHRVDKVLLDAPCTGLGVLRRHPEGKWHKDEASVKTLAQKQRELIAHALKQIKKGGTLIYSVCSFEKEETISHIEWLVEVFGAKVEIMSPVHLLPDYFKRYVTRDDIMLIYSGNQDEMDGFGAFCVQIREEI